MVGGTGFIGINLVDALLGSGAEVVVTKRRRSITAFVRQRRVRFVDADLDDSASLHTALEGIDVMYLAGAHYPRYSTQEDEAIATGVRHVRHAAEAARARGIRLVYTSSVGALKSVSDGLAGESDIPESMPRGSVYRATKWAMERELERHMDAGLDAVTLLPGACLGPFDARVGTSGIMLAAATGTLPWWVDGLVNVVDVGDVAQGHIAAAERGRPGARYCLVGSNLTLGQLLHTVVSRYGGVFPRSPIAAERARVLADEAEHAAELRRGRVPFPRELVDLLTSGQRVSSAKAERELGAAFRPLEETLDRTWKWFVEHHYVPARSATEGCHE